MKLTLRPEWRLWPLSSFLGVMDLKTGVTIALLFALLNKVAGIYGLLALVFGAGGSFAQLSLYIYSTAALVGLVWGLNAVNAEDPKHTLYFAHLFFFDHILSTTWTLFFAVVWWVYTPHDGRRQANSAAQEDLIRVSPGATLANLTDAERATQAFEIWDKEKGTAASVIIVSWIAKIYFALLVYSYAIHLRKGSYRNLPLSKPNLTTSSQQGNGHLPSHYVENSALAGLDDDDEATDDFYQVPVRSPTTNKSRRPPKTTKTHNPKASFAEFISANRNGPSFSPDLNEKDLEDEVLFDEGSTSSASSSSRRGPSSSSHGRDSSVASSSRAGSSIHGH